MTLKIKLRQMKMKISQFYGVTRSLTRVQKWLLGRHTQILYLSSRQTQTGIACPLTSDSVLHNFQVKSELEAFLQRKEKAHHLLCHRWKPECFWEHKIRVRTALSEFSISSQKLYKITLCQQVPPPSLHGKAVTSWPAKKWKYPGSFWPLSFLQKKKGWERRWNPQWLGSIPDTLLPSFQMSPEFSQAPAFHSSFSTKQNTGANPQRQQLK